MDEPTAPAARAAGTAAGALCRDSRGRIRSGPIQECLRSALYCKRPRISSCDRAAAKSRDGLMESAVLQADGPVLLPSHLPIDALQPKVDVATEGSSLLTLSELERRHISRVLAESGGQMNIAAEILGIHRNTLRRKLSEYGITAQ